MASRCGTILERCAMSSNGSAISDGELHSISPGAVHLFRHSQSKEVTVIVSILGAKLEIGDSLLLEARI